MKTPATRTEPGALVWLWVCAACGQPCPPASVPPPMTETRARAIDPSVVTGGAFTTTLVRGDCRATKVAPPSSCGSVNPACASDRAPLRVQVVPIDTSVPLAPACNGQGGHAVGDLAPLSILDRSASAAGELVASLPASRYTVYVSEDGECAACGLVAAGSACLLTIVEGRLSIRDLVLDRSTR